ncbi:tetratricopeptide repeat protein [Flavobacterium sp. MAH-1]|uniref:histidine kinase n=1 Tax=Flavobacterium agri TaxID=2743471 RepID=A0A7Y9C601_9FLAO|nr:histidine kinase dimerization/phosphoacceptor domain -containing protein [Flavobacterium agri]NUY81496.1 tetratricopeptide repeat protein [Flavobacterium agri]NYA71520.1 tetratricopeptide repeat protein [Flavobacterium agri]
MMRKVSISTLVLHAMTLLFGFQLNAQAVFKNEDDVLKSEKMLAKQDKDTVLANRYFEICFWYLDNKASESQKIRKYCNAGGKISNELKFSSGKGKYFLIMSRLYQNDHKYNDGIKASTSAITMFTAVRNYNLLGESWVMLWSNHSLNGLANEKRIPYLLKAATFFSKARNFKREGDCYKEAGDMSQVVGKAGEALNYLKLAAAAYKKAKYDRLHEVYDLLGRVYATLGDYKEAIKYGWLAVKTAEKLGDDSLLMCTIYNRLGSSYVQLQQFDEGLKHYKKALAYAERYHDMDGMITMVFNIAEVLLAQGKEKEALTFTKTMLAKYPGFAKTEGTLWDSLLLHLYAVNGHMKMAQKHALQIERTLSSEPTDYNSYSNTVNTLLKYYDYIKDYKKAQLWVAKLDSVSKRTDSGINRDKIEFWKFKLDSINGNYKEALASFQRLKKITDKVLTEAKSRQINQLGVLYETEKKSKDILVLKRQALIQQSNLEREKLIRNIILGGLVLLTIIAFLLYKGYRLKQRSNAMLKTQQAEIHDKNASLEHLLQEKEWLLREIHHRVKNNLHMVTGLLESQTEFIKGKEAKKAISDSQHRIQAMSLIHQKLYQTENLSMTDMPSYIADLVDYLQQSYEENSGVRFILDIEKVDFPLSHTIPLGLILNEAITNSFKYAFRDRQDKFIRIHLKKEADGRFLLEIIDNGIGLPEGFEYENASSLGTRLIYGLSQDIHADIAMYSDKGTHIDIRFTLPQHHE